MSARHLVPWVVYLAVIFVGMAVVIYNFLPLLRSLS